MNAVVIIPARYAAQRFPGKPLARETGKYLIEHVWERAKGAARVSRVIVATDDQRIADACKGFGAEVAMTPASCPTGTDRVARVAETLEGVDVVVNVQGDEPEMAPASIDRLVDLMAKDDAPLGTLTFPCDEVAQWRSPDVVKIVFAAAKSRAASEPQRGRAIYFSRSGIPFSRAAAGAPPTFWKHVGVYAYRRDFLRTLAALPPSRLEQTEMLEQLRVIEAGYPIAVIEAVEDSRGVDTPEQYADFVVRWRLQHG